FLKFDSYLIECAFELRRTTIVRHRRTIVCPNVRQILDREYSGLRFGNPAFSHFGPIDTDGSESAGAWTAVGFEVIDDGVFARRQRPGRGHLKFFQTKVV